MSISCGWAGAMASKARDHGRYNVWTTLDLPTRHVRDYIWGIAREPSCEGRWRAAAFISCIAWSANKVYTRVIFESTHWLVARVVNYYYEYMSYAGVVKSARVFLPPVLAAAVSRCRCASCVTTCGYKYKNVIYYFCWTPLLRGRIKLLHNTVYYSMSKGHGAGERRKRYKNKQSHVNVQQIRFTCAFGSS